MSGDLRPGWQKLSAGAAAIALVAWVALDFGRFKADFWPPDRSPVGPNLVAAVVQAAVLAVVLVLVWPPTRRRIHAFADRKLAPLHDRLEALHGRHDQHAEHLEQLGKSLAALHAKVDQLPKEP